jgi:ornithine carbamoyltransferase
MKPIHFLTVSQLSPGDLMQLIDRASELKEAHKKGKHHHPLAGRTLGLLFFKSSTRTRISFEAAMVQLGGASLFLPAQDLQINRGESVADTARVLSRYLDALVIRTFAHEEVEAWASDAAIPVINGLTDRHHPCQILGDLLTIRERFGTLKGLTLAYIGDGNNVAHSLIEGAAAAGMTIRLACPDGFRPEDSIVNPARERAKKTGGAVEIGSDPKAAAREADILYTDVWTSMGQEAETEKRKKIFSSYRIDDALVGLAKPTARVMHCLPAYRGLEITAEVLDGPRSIVWDQAENRLHAQKALLERLLT